GSGNRQKTAQNSVLIWDASIKEVVIDMTCGSDLLGIRLQRDRIFLIERKQIHCFSFPNNSRKLFTIETGDNPNGICEVTPLTSATELQLIAYPGHRMGSVQLLDLSTTGAVPHGGVSSLED